MIEAKQVPIRGDGGKVFKLPLPGLQGERVVGGLKDPPQMVARRANIASEDHVLEGAQVTCFRVMKAEGFIAKNYNAMAARVAAAAGHPNARQNVRGAVRDEDKMVLLVFHQWANHRGRVRLAEQRVLPRCVVPFVEVHEMLRIRKSKPHVVCCIPGATAAGMVPVQMRQHDKIDLLRRTVQAAEFLQQQPGRGKSVEGSFFIAEVRRVSTAAVD